jgi:hypothetical protein
MIEQLNQLKLAAEEIVGQECSLEVTLEGLTIEIAVSTVHRQSVVRKAFVFSMRRLATIRYNNPSDAEARIREQLLEAVRLCARRVREMLDVVKESGGAL